MAVCRDRLASVGRVQRGLAGVSVAEEGTEAWWAALVYVLGQPSEVRRRAAWEAVAGTRGAGLEWAEVEARVRAAERATMRTVQPAVTGLAGPVRSAGASGTGRSVKVWTEKEVVAAVRMGGEVDLGGAEVVLTDVVGVVGAGTVGTIRNGTLRGVCPVPEGMHILGASERGELRLERVRVVGTGVCCAEGGRVTLLDTHVTDTPGPGVLCSGRGSKMVMQGGCVMGLKESDGVYCLRGGQVELIEVEIGDCQQCGVLSVGQGSRVVVGGGRITGSKEQHGVECQDGGRAEMREVVIADCKKYVVAGHGQGSKVVIQGGSITGSKEGSGLACAEGGQAEVRDVEIADCKKCGVVCNGQGSKVVIQGGSITGSKLFDGVACEQGGHAEVHGVVIHDCQQYGLCCDNISTLRHSGCTVSGCGKGARYNC